MRTIQGAAPVIKFAAEAEGSSSMRLPFLRISLFPLAAALLFARPDAAIAAELAPCEALAESDVRGVLGANWKRNEAFSKGEACVYQGSPNAIALVFGKGEHVGQIEASPAATRDWAVLEKLATAAYGRLP